MCSGRARERRWHFQPSESLKALAYFGDGDLKSLTPAEKNTLVQTVTSVRNLPDVRILSRQLGAS